MARIEGRPAVQLDVCLRLNESEARALAALTSYGDESVCKVIAAHVSEGLVRDHGDGLVSFLKSVRSCLPGLLTRADDARKAFTRT